MKCREAQHLWNERIDADMPDAAVEQHLQNCPACRGYVQQMTHLLHALDSLRESTESIASTRPAENLPTFDSRRRARFQWRVAGMAVAAMLMLAVGSVMFFSEVIETRRPLSTDPTVVMPDSPAGRLGITLRDESAVHFIAVGQPTTAPNVQVFRLYDTLRPASDGESESQGT
jgi:predicted anti-sigma-YlaC factor YlaD